MKLPILGLVASAAALAFAANRAGDEVIDYTFSKAPVNSRGVASMADLRGKPVLIDFWGTH
jgi:hypothetical protein